MVAMAKRARDLKNIEIEMIPYDGTPNPHNPHDRLTPEARYKKLVTTFAQILLEMRAQENFEKIMAGIIVNKDLTCGN